MPELGIDLALRVHGPRNRRSQVVTKAIPKTVNRNFESPFGKAGRLSKLSISSVGGVPSDTKLELFKKLGFSGGLHFGLEGVAYGLEQLLGPCAVEELFWAEFRGGVLLVSLLCLFQIEREGSMARASFLGVALLALVEQEVFEGPEKVGPKFAAPRLGLAKRALLNPTLKEGLGEILGVRNGTSRAPQKRVKRGPVATEKPLHGLGAVFRLTLRPPNEAPLSGHEACVTGPVGGTRQTHWGGSHPNAKKLAGGEGSPAAENHASS